MDLVKDILSNVWVERCFWSVVVIMIGIMIYRIVARFLDQNEKKNSKVLSSKKNKTLIRMLKSTAGYVIGIFTILVILQIFGVNVTSMLAGVGIASIIIGFALQDAMKDIFRGLEIISDGYYNIGDVIHYGNTVGQVLSISLRTTRVQDINTMNIVSIANRDISQVEVDTGYIYLPIPLPYEMKIKDAENIIQDIVAELSHSELITSVAYQGIVDFASSSRNYQIVITTSPIDRLRVRRDALHVISTTLESHHISVPYQQVTIHSK